MKITFCVLLSALLMLASASALAKASAEDKPAASKKNDSKKEELKKRFEARYEKLRELRRQGIVGETYAGKPVTLEDLKVAGAMTVLMREAMKPNLVQTLEGGPAFIHAGFNQQSAHK